MYLESGIFMHQKKYMVEVLKRFKMMGFKLIETTVQLNVKLTKSEDKGQVDDTMFRQVVGSLTYICHNILEITFRVDLVNRFINDPDTQT